MATATKRGTAAKSKSAVPAKSAKPAAGKTGTSTKAVASSKASSAAANKTKAATGASKTLASKKITTGKAPVRKSIGESKSKRPSTKREPQVDVLAQQAAVKAEREADAKQKPGKGKVEADDRSSRSAGRHSGAADAEYVTEKGDARRRDPNINKNSQAQKDDVRDGQRDQSPHSNRRNDGQTQDGGARQAQASRSRPPRTTGPTRK